ncbi:TPA: hypothetical protein N0F65_001804 [Lagenidium giganteum]|uniref:PFU domain-containing protein n=1 Tax=Lagenidium giganteum TaxID=4803 RepID=A0AAV2Z5E9_9STRA|nr:TPA: hypothetical protein N0F65_001804 [Lagenidium giganteum]
MWNTARHCMLLLATLGALSHVVAQSAASNADVVFTMPITLDGNLKDLHLMRGETYENAALSFARENGLSEQANVVEQLSQMLKQRMEEIEGAAKADQRAPLVQFELPLTIDNRNLRLIKLEGESAEATAQRFLQDAGFSAEVQTQLYPQILNVINQKLQELQPAQKELFALSFEIDGRAATARHFENGNPIEEAKETLQAMGIAANDNLVSQIANLIQDRMRASESTQERAESSSGIQTTSGLSQQQDTRRELFSIPLTINEQPAMLVHYDGLTARESAIRFLSANGITDPADVGQYLPQLEPLIDAELAKRIQEEAERERTQAEEMRQQQEVLRAQQATRSPLLEISIDIGNQQAILRYYEGDSIDRTAELFLEQAGLGNDPAFNDNAIQLAGILRDRLKELLAQRQAETPVAEQPQVPTTEPLFTVPIELGRRQFNLDYYEGQQPRQAANQFCVEKYEILRAEVGSQFSGEELQRCESVLTETLTKIISEAQQTEGVQREATQATGQQLGQATHGEQAQPVASTTEERVLLFTLDIDVDEESAQLPYYKNDDPDAVATAFCQRYNVDLANVPALVAAIREQLNPIGG